MATCLMAWWVVRDLGRGNGYKSSSIICYPCLHACCDLILNFFGRRIDHDAIIINTIHSSPFLHPETKPNQTKWVFINCYLRWVLAEERGWVGFWE
jgi:hypothetical protein